MAFKMKGSAFKLNKVATKSTMKMAKKAMKEESAMDMKEKSPMELKTSYKMKEAMAKMKDKSAMKQTKPDYPDIDGDGNTTESMKKAAADKKSAMKMQSPMKQEVAATTEPVEEKVNPYGDPMRSVDANTWKQINTGDISENWRGLQEDLKRARRLGYDDKLIGNLKRTMGAVQKHMESENIPLQ